MSLHAGRRHRTILAPVLLNPYEEGEEKVKKSAGNNNSRSINTIPSLKPPGQALRHSEAADERLSLNLSQPMPPPLPPPPVVLVSPGTQVSEDTGKSDEVLRPGRKAAAFPPPPQHMPAGALRDKRVPSPVRVPRTRGPKPSKAAQGDNADGVAIPTAAGPEAALTSSTRNAVSRETRRPGLAPTVQHACHASFSSHDVEIQNVGTTDDIGAGNSRSHEAEVGEKKPSQPSQPPLKDSHFYNPFVVQSAFTQKNPFRNQTFEAFCYAPDYSAPADCRTYHCDSNEWVGFQRTSDGDFREQRATEMNSQSQMGPSTSSLSKYILIGPALGTLQSGDWFYKWTRHGRVHERYVWLDIQRHSLLWGPSPRSSFVLLSHLRLDAVMDLRPDCMFDEATQRTFYRFFLVREEQTVILATELRDKFDLWFDALRKIIFANELPRQQDQSAGFSDGTAAGTMGDKRASHRNALNAVLPGHGSKMHAAQNMFTDRRTQVLPSD
ncbi:hypothetical protein C3747_447g16 [Trypanosoma cruzi]|uniref:Pleckstrin homology domain-containing protein n=2 Tax=Trypanosoma cruzi TaxID=5693 RepID=Q4D4Z1_TRYCC|nr:hypothetical protein, conserved [Trypanosoma cruzi]EAN87595.1 hypothetical protein, conserved [Trypanosoma cruzi]PWU88036.1 hypothetical protein C3747_447g16 [Trypanosoma cruzi]RNC60967.1 hypothetical protein TcCL_ESM01429 [Trypanosoma cruzi]|eukprot:XP_809446.1 hypothetical protein [Trypanosoma cruzi strain CL Brener]